MEQYLVKLLFNSRFKVGLTDVQGPGSAERRVWKAGQTPRNTKASEVLALEGPSGATQVPNGLSGRREPLPMTESARRIAMALDAMLPVSHTTRPPTVLPSEQQHLFLLWY